jgi:hypothetical protein
VCGWLVAGYGLAVPGWVWEGGWGWGEVCGGCLGLAVNWKGDNFVKGLGMLRLAALGEFLTDWRVYGSVYRSEGYLYSSTWGLKVRNRGPRSDWNRGLRYFDTHHFHHSSFILHPPVHSSSVSLVVGHQETRALARCGASPAYQFSEV